MSGTGKLYCAVNCDIFYGSAGEAIISSATSEATVVVDREVAAVVGQCGVPRTLAGHLAHLALRTKPEDTERLRALLEAVTEAGLVRPIAQPVSPVAEPRANPISLVTIPTCDRPQMVLRCLESFLAHWESRGPVPTVVVIDGSRTAETAAETRAAVRAAAQRTAGSIKYVGPDQRSRMRAASVRAGCDPDLVTWLIPDVPPRYAAGAARNVGLLVSAGRRLMTVDDDVVCSIRVRAPGGVSGVSFVGHVEPRETSYCDNRAVAMGAGVAADVDLLGEHAQLLGQPLETLGHRGGPIDLAQACRHLVRAIDNTGSGHVRVSWTGIAGDSAAYCPDGVLFNTGADRSALVGDPVLFETALKTREVFRAVRRVTVTDESRLMLYCAAIDNEQLLPPFQPTGFNEDGLFGWTLRACDSGAFVAQLPLAVTHDSARSSTYEHTGSLSASQVRTAEVLQWLCRPWGAACHTRSVPARMRSLGECLSHLAGMDREAFRQHLKRTVVEAKWQASERCLALQKDFDYPPFWRRAFADYRETQLRSMSAPGFYVPIEWIHAGLLDGVAALQNHLGMYARALAAWPELWNVWRSVDSDDLLKGERP
jgi:hypothetical protein